MLEVPPRKQSQLFRDFFLQNRVDSAMSLSRYFNCEKVVNKQTKNADSVCALADSKFCPMSKGLTDKVISS